MCAVDVVAIDGNFKAKFIALSLDQDWSVGVASNFIHLDQRSRYCELPQVGNAVAAVAAAIAIFVSEAKAK